MKRKKQSPLWPYLGILTCLFVLSVTAPRAWVRLERKASLDQVLQQEVRRPIAAQPVPSSDLEQADDDVESSSLAPVAVPSPLTSPQIVATPISVETRRVEQPAAGAVAEPPVPVFAPLPEFAAQAAQPQDSEPRQRQPIDVANLPNQPPAVPEMPADIDERPASEAESNEAPLSAWPLPRVLLDQLDALADACPEGAWASEALEGVEQLCSPQTTPELAQQIAQKLETLCDQHAQAPRTSVAIESQYIRTRYALSRWVDVWKRAAALEALQPADLVHPVPADQLKVCLADVDLLTRKSGRGAGWREFLQLDALSGAAASPTDEQLRQQLARKVLDRLSSDRLSKSQRKFVTEGPFATLAEQLRSWAAEPVAARRLLEDLDRYEVSCLPSDAQLVANDLRGLIWSSPSAANQTGEALETHYRNANVRIAVAAQLVNRMVPQPKPIEAPVRDRLLNVPVYGRSTTWTDLSVRLVPDDRRIRLGLEAEGLVDSNTLAVSGPATFHNEGRSTFLVRKLLVLGPQGLAVWPAIAEADNSYNYLVSVETEFDGVPLVGSLVRNIACNQHEERRGEARMEVEQKVALRARRQLDAEVQPQLDKAAEKLQQKQLATIKRLGLELEPVALSTTEERIVARLRLANAQQLGAHTPRPRAPSDSWLSLQLHQTALNNTIEGLGLNGRKFTLPELFTWIAEKLDAPQMAKLDDIPDDVTVTFADRDAVRLRCEEGNVEVTLAFARLTRGNSSWRNFTVRTLYRPESQGLEPRFVRDDTIHLSLRKIEPGLRAIFSRVLSKNRDLRLLDAKTTSDPRMQDLQISQFVVEDGWIGLAYSPRRGAKVARQPGK